MIFQDPMSALHPYYSIGNQLIEAWSLYNEGDKAAGKKRAIEMLDLVGIPDATKRVDEFPHQFSGGMRQRVMIAMALINNPSLLIADEPTTALDVTIQSEVLELLRNLARDRSLLFISHDLPVVASMSNDVRVLHQGHLVASGSISDLAKTTDNDYVKDLFESAYYLDGTLNHG